MEYYLIDVWQNVMQSVGANCCQVSGVDGARQDVGQIGRVRGAAQDQLRRAPLRTVLVGLAVALCVAQP